MTGRGGWFACPPDAWEIAAAYIPKPWPQEAAVADLRWWADRVRMGEARMPGRATLQARWGWEEWPTRSLLADRARWADRFHEEIPPGLHDASKHLPRDLHAASAQPPQRLHGGSRPARRNAGNPEVASRGSPADLQVASSASPAEALPLRARDHSPPDHKTHITSGETAHAAVGCDVESSPPQSRGSALGSPPSGPKRGAASGVLTAWQGVWRAVRGAVPLPQRRDREHAMSMAAHLEESGWPTDRPDTLAGLQRAFAEYLAAQAAGQAWPPPAEPPSLGHAVSQIRPERLKEHLVEAFFDHEEEGACAISSAP